MKLEEIKAQAERVFDDAEIVLALVEIAEAANETAACTCGLSDCAALARFNAARAKLEEL